MGSTGTLAFLLDVWVSNVVRNCGCEVGVVGRQSYVLYPCAYVRMYVICVRKCTAKNVTKTSSSCDVCVYTCVRTPQTLVGKFMYGCTYVRCIAVGNEAMIKDWLRSS